MLPMTEFAFSNRAHDLWLREIQSSERRLGEGATTGRQSAHRTLAPTDPPQVDQLLCSHLRVIASVDQHSSSQSKSVRSSFLPNSKCCSSFESTSRDCSRDRALRQTPARGTSRHVSGPPDPGGEVRGSSVCCILGM